LQEVGGGGSEDSPKNSGILQIENAILLIPAYEQGYFSFKSKYN
jgi:hypothetical protein